MELNYKITLNILSKTFTESPTTFTPYFFKMIVAVILLNALNGISGVVGYCKNVA
jgi:hypothetical protein